MRTAISRAVEELRATHKLGAFELEPIEEKRVIMIRLRHIQKAVEVNPHSAKEGIKRIIREYIRKNEVEEAKEIEAKQGRLL